MMRGLEGKNAMYGLINRSIQCFIEDSYGAEQWDAVVLDAGLEFRDFESMLSYPDPVTEDVLAACVRQIGGSTDAILENLGTYLVTHPHMEAVRRLLRFGGHSFAEFIHSLDDLNGRAKLAVPDLELPDLEVQNFTAQNFALHCKWRKAGFGPVLIGIVRAMADDYGALALFDLSVSPIEGGVKETLRIDLLSESFSEGRSFTLARAQ
jgi:hypothetical protein